MNDESTCSARSRSDEDVTRAALAVEADAFTRFIERQRIEVMFELRRLRFGERPVTGQSNRERIETFLTNIREQQQQDKRVPSRRPAVPSAHIADIDALASRRCVSATLSSPAFRRDLENAIRQSIGARPAATVQDDSSCPSVATYPRTRFSNCTLVRGLRRPRTRTFFHLAYSIPSTIQRGKVSEMSFINQSCSLVVFADRSENYMHGRR